MPIRVPTEDGIQELLKLVDLLPPPETNAGQTPSPFDKNLPTNVLVVRAQTLSGAVKSSKSCFPWRTTSPPALRCRCRRPPPPLRSRSFCCLQQPRRCLRKPSSR